MDDEKLKDIALNFQANINDKLLKENMELKKEIKALQTQIRESPEKTGHWILLIHDLYACSECHSKWTMKLNYCPYCGAKMKESR